MPRPTVATDANPYGPKITFRTEDVLPPSAVYVGPSDAIQFQARSPTVTSVITLTLRFLTPQGEIKEVPRTYTVATVGTAVFANILPPAEGFVLSAHLSADASSRGQCFVKLLVRKNVAGADVTLGHLLVQGYLSADDHLSYPQSPTESSLNGRGWTHSIVPAKPPAGANLLVTVPAGVRWILRAVFTQLLCNAIVSQRSMFLSILDNLGDDAVELPTLLTIAANGLGQFTWAPGASAVSTSVESTQSMGAPAELVLGAGWGILLFFTNGSAGDQIQGTALFVEEFIAQ